MAACAAPQTDAILRSPGALPERAEVTGVPFFAQELYHCGPAALAMVLNWTGETVAVDRIVAQVYTPGREGTLRSDILSGVRRNGRLAFAVSDLTRLLQELAAGHPVLVFQNLGLPAFPQWHFAVAIGYDLAAAEMVLHSGTEARRRIPLSTFERTWARGDHWALLVLAPDRLPESADQWESVQAAAGLERAGRLDAAARAYNTILARWEESYPAWFGIGNVRYAQNDDSGAETAFRRALALRPESPAAWNNLAYVLKRSGRRGEAVDAAETAVRLTDGKVPAYVDTLRDMRSP